MVHRRSGASRRSAQKAHQRISDQIQPTGVPSIYEALAGRSPEPVVRTTSGSGRGSKSQGLLPKTQEVIAAVASLCFDQLKPFGRILRKRVAERAQAAGLIPEGCSLGTDSLPDVDVNHIRRVCEESSQLQVESEEGGDWSVTLVGCTPDFVNVYSPCDLYGEKLWLDAQAYFEALEGDAIFLPGGRYSCAQSLVAHNLEFLKEYSLGQVCHIVQLAISQKKILGYLNGAMVPYSSSLSIMKDKCAVCQSPCSNNMGSDSFSSFLPFATWDDARSCLEKMLEEAALQNGGPGKLPLSNVKRLFRSQFHIELSETKLGHSKLSELIQDEHFADFCSVQLEGNGYTVIQKGGHHIERASSKLSLMESLPQDVGVTMPDGVSFGKIDNAAMFEMFENSPFASTALPSFGPSPFSSPIRHTTTAAKMDQVKDFGMCLNDVFEGYPLMPEMPQFAHGMASMDPACFDAAMNPFCMLPPFPFPAQMEDQLDDHRSDDATEQRRALMTPMSIASSLSPSRRQSKSIPKDLGSCETNGTKLSQPSLGARGGASGASGSTSARSDDGSTDQEDDSTVPRKIAIDPFYLDKPLSADETTGLASTFAPPGLMAPSWSSSSSVPPSPSACPSRSSSSVAKQQPAAAAVTLPVCLSASVTHSVVRAAQQHCALRQPSYLASSFSALSPPAYVPANPALFVSPEPRGNYATMLNQQARPFEVNSPLRVLSLADHLM